MSCFHSEPQKEFGGPDGGDGGNGGHVVLRGTCCKGQLGEKRCVCSPLGRDFPSSHPHGNLDSKLMDGHHFY